MMSLSKAFHILQLPHSAPDTVALGFFTTEMWAGFTACLLRAVRALADQEQGPETYSGEPIGTHAL